MDTREVMVAAAFHTIQCSRRSLIQQKASSLQALEQQRTIDRVAAWVGSLVYAWFFGSAFLLLSM